MSKSPKVPETKHHEKESKDGFFSLTLGRKKKMKEVNELEQDGRDAIDGAPSQQVDYDPSNFQLEENEERTMIDKLSLEDSKVKELQRVLMDWINNVLVEQRIIVQDIQEDLFDGQVLQKLLEKLGDIKLQVPEVTQTAQGQKDKLRAVLLKVCEQLDIPRWDDTKWSVDTIHSKNLVSILHLLVALATHYRAPIRLPEKVALKVIVVTKRDGKLNHKVVSEEVTSTLESVATYSASGCDMEKIIEMSLGPMKSLMNIKFQPHVQPYFSDEDWPDDRPHLLEMTGGRFERDAFDTLFDHAPDKLSIVKRSLIEFANRHLEKVNLTVTDLDTQFADGVYLVLLMGLLEGYFVPLYSFSLTPDTFEDKVHNIQFAFELMQDAGLPKPKARPEDVANCELKSTLRVLYNLFTKYKRV